MLAAAAGLTIAPPATLAAERADAIHAEMWRRFIACRWFTLYDYAGLRGEVILPTREDCDAASAERAVVVGSD